MVEPVAGAFFAGVPTDDRGLPAAPFVDLGLADLEAGAEVGADVSSISTSLVVSSADIVCHEWMNRQYEVKEPTVKVIC